MPNDLLGHLMRARLNGTQMHLVLAVVRFTFGFHQENTSISVSDFAKNTGHPRRSIVRELKRLRSRNVLVEHDKGGRNHNPSRWRVNMQFDEWLVPNRSPVPTGDEMVTTSGDGSVTTTGVKSVIPLKKKERKKNRRASRKPPDPRFHPLKVFFFEEYQASRQAPLVADGSDFRALADLLKRLPDVPIKVLKDAVARYLASRHPYHLNQGKPLRFWAYNVNPFLAAATGAGPRADEEEELPLLN